MRVHALDSSLEWYISVVVDYLVRYGERFVNLIRASKLSAYF